MYGLYVMEKGKGLKPLKSSTCAEPSGGGSEASCDHDEEAQNDERNMGGGISNRTFQLTWSLCTMDGSGARPTEVHAASYALERLCIEDIRGKIHFDFISDCRDAQKRRYSPHHLTTYLALLLRAWIC